MILAGSVLYFLTCVHAIFAITTLIHVTPSYNKLNIQVQRRYWFQWDKILSYACCFFYLKKKRKRSIKIRLYNYFIKLSLEYSHVFKTYTGFTLSHCMNFSHIFGTKTFRKTKHKVTYCNDSISYDCYLNMSSLTFLHWEVI